MRAKTLVSPVGTVLTAEALGGLASGSAESTWYAQLKKPSFQPPREAFPIAWTWLSTRIWQLNRDD